MRISIVSLKAGGSDEIWVGFELVEGENIAKESFLISTLAYTELGLFKGECDRQIYDAVEREAEIYSAFKKGMYILGFGACSKNMLVSKLRAKGFAADISREAVGRISDCGFLDEEENARREAERCCAKLWGESRIRAKLCERRYSHEAVEQALFFLEDSGVDFDANCKSLINERYPVIPADRGEMQKLIAAVCRQGYTVSQIKNACARLAAERKRNSIFE